MAAQRRAAETGRHGLLAAIAAEAGVSAATVSKVVHRRPDVGAATRARVEELLTRHGFVRPGERPPDAPRQIAVVFRDLLSPYTLEVARGITDAADDLGATVLLGTTGRRSISRWLAECETAGADGLIVVISMLSAEDRRRSAEQGLPVVLVDPLGEPPPGVPGIGVTDERGARQAVEHLLDLGHRRIAVVAGRSHSLAGAARLRGYRAALEGAAVAYDPALVRATDFDHAEALAAARSLLRSAAPPTAVFATSDVQALGVLEAARLEGRRVPDDLSVVSFDDTPAASTASPPLSAVRQPFERIGRAAVQTVLDLADGRPTAPGRIELPTELVLRASTAPAGGASG
ncbi:LacI family DNA-binding transcriptional regulator [Kitasatospora sp. NPDC057198]|uniref:LacI family DNA-binding transcriptional regulator n=1 Tax=Kitasatospora sp. NPDC057198 TaxID=3346046 RepID=UPI00362E8F6D